MRFRSLPWWALLALLLPVAGQTVRGQSDPVVLSGLGSEWRLWRGPTHPSPATPPAWRQGAFDDVRWELAPAPFWYGEPGLFANTGTELANMINIHSTLFLRRRFTVTDPSVFESLEWRAICDDGFRVWLNGTPVTALNAPQGEPTADALATANIAEPIVLTAYSITGAPTNLLVRGENVIAVQVLNVGLTSSDLAFDGELVAQPRATAAPVVLSVSPVPGPLAALNQITVTFSEPVQGVRAEDFLVNGIPALGVSGNGLSYTFSFATPAFGEVLITWSTFHAIRDFESPPRPFEITAPGSVWGYDLLDPAGPALTLVEPPPGSTLRTVTQVQVTFDKPVIGLDAADLLLAGTPATLLTGVGAGPYLFEFPAVTSGSSAAVTWRADHGISSDALEPHAFRATGWSYVVDPQARPAPLVITEFMAENYTAYRDEDADPEDWIEIFNPTARAVSLEGWSLSNDNDEPSSWVFPAVNLGPGQYLIVFASGKDRRPAAGGILHTGFKLNPNAGFLGLYGPGLPREIVSSVIYQRQGPDYSLGRDGGTGDWRYFERGSPGRVNPASTIRTAMADVEFSVTRGFFDHPFQLYLHCPTPGAEIRYTLDGSPPTATTGVVYTNALPVSVTRIVRAAAFRPNALPSRVQTHTYLLNQAATRLRLPVLSLVTATNHLYGRTGIMEVSPRNTTKRGAAWERPVSAEYILPDRHDGFQVDAGLRLQGGDYVRGQYNYRSGSLPFSKYSFRLYFRGEYGTGRLEYPLFPETTQRSFDTIVLRAGMNDHSNPYLIDEFVRSLARDCGQPSPVGTFVHLFLNGVYKGYYNPCERIDVDFLQAYHGGGEQWDVMAQLGEVREGDASAWNMLRTLTARDLSIPANYLAVANRLDLTNFVDYLCPLIYVDNDDWPHNNWRAARERTTAGRYRFYVWDAEWAMGFQNGHGPT